MDFIQKKVKKIMRIYRTNDPFELAEQLNIIVIYEDLGEINGYYNSYARQKFIHINNKLDYRTQNFTCAHELGHATMHPMSNTPFLKKGTFFSINKLEIEANQFALDLLIDNVELMDLIKNNLYTTYQLSNYYGVPLEVIEYKLNRLYRKHAIEKGGLYNGLQHNL